MIQTNPFSISEHEYIKLMFTQYYRQPRAYLLPIFALIWIWVNVNSGQLSSWTWLFLVLVFIFLQIGIYWQARKYYRSLQTLQDTHVYTFGQDDVFYEGTYSKGSFKWDIVKKVLDRPNWLLFYTSTQIMHPIPKKAFNHTDLPALKILLDELAIKNTL